MLGFNLLKIIHLSSLLLLSGFVLTSFNDKKISKLKWFLISINFIFLGLSGFFLLTNLGFMTSKWPAWVVMKIVGFFIMITVSIFGLKKLWSEKLSFTLWLLFSIVLVVVSIQKFYY